MSAKTSIEWTQRTWNPLVAYLNRDVKVTRKNGEVATVPAGTRGWFCTKCSPGCAHCYAEKINLRLGNGLEYATKNLDEISFEMVNLRAPLHWRKPQMVFVNSMTDLFHEAVPDELIDQVFAVMAIAQNHTFQVLTKRSKRMRDYFADAKVSSRLDFAVTGTQGWNPHAVDLIRSLPLPNVWLGVSVENRACADERVPLLLQTPANVRFLSCEPLLGPVDLTTWLIGHEDNGIGRTAGACIGWTPPLDWVIAGGESGPKARPMHPNWARSLRDQCISAGVPFFFKQWGEWYPQGNAPGQPPNFPEGSCAVHGKQVHEFPDGLKTYLIGKKAIKKNDIYLGRFLDGREWNEMPTPAGEAPRSKLQAPGKHQAPSSNAKESNG